MSTSIAIIGMAGRFPGAADLEGFWRNLAEGIEAVRCFTDEELEEAGIPRAVLCDPRYVKARAPLEGIDQFDAAFFGFHPREAAAMDPQHRLFLEVAWQALESAGYPPGVQDGLVGVFAGASTSTYLLRLARETETVSSMEARIGNDKDYLATRVSYKLDLKGPSVTVQTGCSTALVAVQLACQSLLQYQCDYAVAGGVSAIPDQVTGYFYREGGIGSPDGHCRAFDADARGTVGGSGVGVVVLRRLEEALAAKDSIRAVILGAAVNNDGAAKVGFTAPSIQGQAAVITMAQAMAEVDPETIGYIEAHGTGTALGDPIELAALSEAFGTQSSRRGFCGIGSVKTNIGHLDAAAGVAGLIKTVLALENRQIPPSLHFRRPNPKFDLAASPFYVNTELRDWPATGAPRRAGVSSFGIGGTNAHVVIEEAPVVPAGPPARHWQLLPLSARSEAAVDAAEAALADFLARHPDLDLADVAYTLQAGRRPFEYRRVLVAAAGGDLRAELGQNRASGRPIAAEPSIAFLFPGQGAQQVGMAADLYRGEPLFRREVDRCAELLAPRLGGDLLPLITNAPETGQEAGSLEQTALAQPALFVTEYALARLLMSWGIRPAAMIGHSLGEYVAACLAGVLTLRETLDLVAARGALMQSLPPGAMLAVSLPAERLGSLRDEGLSLAAINGPSLTVLSGPLDAIERAEARLAAEGAHCRRLHTSHAFHSPAMEPMTALFRRELERVRWKWPQIPYLSNLTGTWITAAAATDPESWIRHLLAPVRFSDGIAELLRTPDRVLLEVGPGKALATFAKAQAGRGAEVRIVSTMRRPPAGGSAVEALLFALGRLWIAGVQIDWDALQGGARRRVPLPTYPFDRQRFWVDRPVPTSPQGETWMRRRENVWEWLYVPSWKRSLPPEEDAGPESHPWLLFLDDGGVGREMAQRLRERGAEVFTVAAGGCWERRGSWDYVLEPGQREQYDALLAEIRAVGSVPRRIVHLWGLDPVPEGPAAFAHAQERGLYSLLHLTRAGGGLSGEVQLTVVTSQVQDVTGEEDLVPEKATVQAVCRVLPQEISGVLCRHVDLPIPRTETVGDLAGQLLAEVTAGSAEPMVAYRRGSRWVECFLPAAGRQPSAPAPCLRSGGTYLITGGLGKIGLVLAEHLARRAQARLVLLGRSPFPGRDRWDGWLAEHAPEDGVSRTILRLRALESLGSEVVVLTADVADTEQLSAALTLVRERCGELHGVIHAVGNADPQAVRPVAETTPALCERQLRGKVQGLAALDRLLAGQSLDWCLSMSSLSSVLGASRLCAYTAANLFVDVWCRRSRRRSSFPWISIGWPGWRFEARSQADDFAVEPAEGIEVFERVLSPALLKRAPQILVSTTDLEARAELARRAERTVPPGGTGTAASTHHPRPELRSAYAAPRTETEKEIAALWCELLGLEQVGRDDDFFELGGHSLVGLHLVGTLRERYGAELDLGDLFETQTVAGLATLVASPAARLRRPSPLVLLQPAGSKRPFFCVHPIGGHVFRFLHLVPHLEPDRPFYGIQAPAVAELAESGEQHETLETMGATYLAAIAEVQPHGPYLLGGWSFGSFVAFEMAQQLHRRGEKVALLALIDAPSPGNFRKLAEIDDATLLLELARQRGRKRGHESLVSDREFEALEPEARFQYVLERLQGADLMPQDIGVPWLRHYLQGYRMREQAGRVYTPQLYPGRITLFRARDIDSASRRRLESQGVDFAEPTFGWSKHSPFPVEVRIIPGFHETIVLEPNVQRLAQGLRAAIESAEGDER